MGGGRPHTQSTGAPKHRGEPQQQHRLPRAKSLSLLLSEGLKRSPCKGLSCGTHCCTLEHPGEGGVL